MRASIFVFVAAVSTALGLLVTGLSGCSDAESCSSLTDCPVGFYCVLSFSGGRAEGACQADCTSSEDCEQPGSSASRAVCTNEGRCRVEARPPRLVVTSPEPETRFDEGTERLQIAGQVEMADAMAVVVVTTMGNNGCGAGNSQQVTIENPSGEYTAVPFVLNDILVDPGTTRLIIEADVPGQPKMLPVEIDVDCPGCARIEITAPVAAERTGEGLKLPFLRGRVTPAIEAAIWRVRGAGGVIDGPLPVSGQDFSADDLPLFPGANRLEVVVTGIGTGQGETRCSIGVNAGVSAEAGLRAILTWNGNTSDLDLHLIGPSGAYGDPNTTLSSRSRSPVGFTGVVEDDFDGLGPELLTVATLPDGEYGLLVEAVFDDLEPGSTAFLRVLYDGQTLTAGPIGPRYLQAIRGDLWVAGVVDVSNGQASFRSVNLMVAASNPPTAPPSMWPQLF